MAHRHMLLPPVVANAEASPLTSLRLEMQHDVAEHRIGPGGQTSVLSVHSRLEVSCWVCKMLQCVLHWARASMSSSQASLCLCLKQFKFPLAAVIHAIQCGNLQLTPNPPCCSCSGKLLSSVREWVTAAGKFHFVHQDVIRRRGGALCG